MDKKILSYFFGDIRKALENAPSDINEIRLRINRPLTIIRGGRICCVSPRGQALPSADGSLTVRENDIRATFEAVCRYSVHSFTNDICSGFITAEGGHRVGICGTAVIRGGEVVNVKDISGLNFRIASQITGCAEKIYNGAYSAGLSNIIIAGPPMSGKTTVLRDLCRMLGDRYKVSVIDERGEIAAVYGGAPQNDIGINTDVFNGYSKPAGIETAVRVMSPDVLVCDEAGGSGDLAAFEYAMTCGIRIAASVHAASLEDVTSRIPFLKRFDYIFFLSADRNIRLVRVRDI